MSGVDRQSVRTPFPPAPKGLAFIFRGDIDFPLSPTPGTLASASAHARYAMSRGVEFWHSIAPEHFKRWQRAGSIDVHVSRGRELNAYYDRQSLSFYQFPFTRLKKTIFSAESCDVVYHELGHAVLDALRPDLWDMMSVEAAAFHESFGDMSALLIGLQDPGTRELLTEDAAPSIYSSSRLSCIAESLGWGVRQVRSDAAAPDCLRNAVNAFYYRNPSELPPTGPDSALTSEPHSFSRVFTGGAYEALSLMHLTHKQPSADTLHSVSLAMAKILIRAIKSARATPDFFAQVAAEMVKAADLMGESAFAQAIRTAFVRRGILSLSTAAAIAADDADTSKSGKRSSRAAVATTPNIMAMPADELGMSGAHVLIECPNEPQPGEARSAALTGFESEPRDAATSGAQFAAQLMRRGRIDTCDHKGCAVSHPRTRKTHEFAEQDGVPKIVRRFFDCGLDAYL